jgi:TetR/AcrR family transcriptional repressor of nem operon
MRYSRQHKEDTHRRIVQKASERFRGEGIDSVGIASLMQSVGLTVGGFYAHFESKEDLIAEACATGFRNTTSVFRAYLDSKPKGERVAAFIDAYLSRRHRDDPARGCMIAANGAELARHPGPPRSAFTQQINEWVRLIGEAMAEDGIEGDPRALAAGMVGTIVMARAVDDPALSDAFLKSGREALKASLIRN